MVAIAVTMVDILSSTHLQLSIIGEKTPKTIIAIINQLFTVYKNYEITFMIYYKIS